MFTAALWWLRWESICLQCGRLRFDPWVGKIPWRRKWQPTPVLLPGESHVGRSLVGYSSWGRKELDRTERAGPSQGARLDKWNTGWISAPTPSSTQHLVWYTDCTLNVVALKAGV